MTKAKSSDWRPLAPLHRALERLWPRGLGQAAASSRTLFWGTHAWLPGARGFQSPAVKVKVAHWTSGIKQGMTAVPLPPRPASLLALYFLWSSGNRGNFPSKLFVEDRG